MSGVIEIAMTTVFIGAGATIVMDIWLMILKLLDVPTLNFAFLGRWIGHLYRGQWFHRGIAKSAPIEHELALGWLAHYAIGIGFAGVSIALFGVEWTRNPAFMPAILFGLATVMAPLLIMQPAMGSGIASSKTAAPVRNCLKSVINHAVFGGGLYLAADVLSRWNIN